MSWFARSIANTLKLDVDDDEDAEQQRLNDDRDEDLSTDGKPEQQVEEDDSPLSPGRGVKEDLSEITKTLTRHIWGVASFLAPPPPAEQSNEQSDRSDPEAASPEPISGIRRDFAEIGGRFRSGISKLSTNIDVSEITKIASNFLQLSPEGDDYVLSKEADAIGVTDEVVAFVRDITMHPETWLDFPLLEDEDDEEDFELSDAQQEHALTVESLAPRLAALRIELCPGYMSEGSFWKIYFVLLHPRLEPHAALLLSTPEIMKARASLTLELKNRSNPQSDAQSQPQPQSQSQTNEVEGSSMNNFPYSEHKPASSEETHQSESIPLEISTTEKHPIEREEIKIVDKSVIQEEPRTNETNVEEQKDEDDDWLKEDTSENVTGITTTTTTTIPIENDEDVSFSDLEEEEDEGDAPINYKKAAYGSDSSTKESRDWVQLGRSSADSGSGQVSAETKESSDWLDVDDIDVA